MAVVTSSNDRKMAAAYRARPEVRTMFDRILTAEMFSRSKPAPDCFLLGMEVFGTTPDTTYVFEDSFNGLKAAWHPKLPIGLATTNSREAIAPLCHCVLDDFTGFTYDKMLQVQQVMEKALTLRAILIDNSLTHSLRLWLDIFQTTLVK